MTGLDHSEAINDQHRQLHLVSETSVGSTPGYPHSSLSDSLGMVRDVGYPYEDLDDGQFERLVVECMRKLFGVGVARFCAGPDGGRDARFDGTAEKFPSSAAPWTGLTIGQAKHTNATNAHFSDTDFSGDTESTILSEEIVRIKKLADDGEVDNYILFTNRRLGGVTGPKLIKRVAENTGVHHKRIYLAGIEYIDDLLHEYPGIVNSAKIDPLDGPLLVSSYELAEVILAIKSELSAPAPAADAAVVDRVSFDEKNIINGMSVKFARTLSNRYLGLTSQIGRFLADPANSEPLQQYEAAVEEFQLKIIAGRSSYASFDLLFNYLVDLLFKRDGVLSRNRALTRAMLFYMYWHCDIGETPDAAAE